MFRGPGVSAVDICDSSVMDQLLGGKGTIRTPAAAREEQDASLSPSGKSTVSGELKLLTVVEENVPAIGPWHPCSGEPLLALGSLGVMPEPSSVSLSPSLSLSSPRPTPLPITHNQGWTDGSWDGSLSPP